MARRGRAYFVAGVFADVGDIPINPPGHLLANQIRLFGMTNHLAKAQPDIVEKTQIFFLFSLAKHRDRSVILGRLSAQKSILRRRPVDTRITKSASLFGGSYNVGSNFSGGSDAFAGTRRRHIGSVQFFRLGRRQSDWQWRAHRVDRLLCGRNLRPSWRKLRDAVRRNDRHSDARGEHRQRSVYRRTNGRKSR